MKKNAQNELENREKTREKKIFMTAVTAMLAKMLAMTVPLITVKYSLNYLGTEVYGLWNTVISFFAVFAFADLGLGSGLQTALSKAQGDEDINKSKKYISSTFAVLIITSMGLLVLFSFVFPIVDWVKFMNVKAEGAKYAVGFIVYIIVSSKLLNIPFALVNRTQLALQEGYRGNIWQCIANIISLVSIVIISKYELGTILMIFVSSFIIVIISILNFLIYFLKQRRDFMPRIKYIDFCITKEMLSIGILFLILSVLTSIGISLDEFVVAKTTSLEVVATYSVLNKSTHLISIGCSMFSAPLWGAFGEALSRNEKNWVKKITVKISLISVIISVSATIFLLLFGKTIFELWIGYDMNYSNFTLLGMCIMQTLLSFIAPYFMVLNAKGIVKKQIFIFGIYTLVSISLKFLLGKYYGVSFIPWTGAICYGFIIVPFVYCMAKKELK